MTKETLKKFDIFREKPPLYYAIKYTKENQKRILSLFPELGSRLDEDKETILVNGCSSNLPIPLPLGDYISVTDNGEVGTVEAKYWEEEYEAHNATSSKTSTTPQ